MGSYFCKAPKINVALKLDKFEGPLDLLLRLIEDEKLPITEVAIAKVTEQYLLVLRNVEGRMEPELLADFLVVAARLLYLKTKALFPGIGAGAPEEGPALEEQLRLYQMFAHAAKAIDRLWHKRQVAFARERLGVNTEAVFTPPPRLTADRLYAIMLEVIKSLEPLVRAPKELLTRTISLRETICRIEKLLQAQTSLQFQTLLAGARSRTEIVVTFLALLELIKQRTVVVKQDTMFQEMVITLMQKSNIKNQN